MNNTFERLEEASENENNNTAEKEVKPHHIFIPKVNNTGSLWQLMKEVTNDKFDLRIINLEKVTIQLESSIAYINIVKELKIKNTEFHKQAKKKL